MLVSCVVIETILLSNINIGHISKFVKYVQEIWVTHHIIKTRRKKAHKLEKLTSRDSLDIIRYHIDEIVLLDNARIVRVILSELSIQVKL